VPKHPGIYLIERHTRNIPEFVESTGGWFKGKNPNYSRAIALTKWVEQASIVYIGKAAGKNGLHERLKQLIDFGCGKPIGHRGGRLLWQLDDSQELLVRWQIHAKNEAAGAETLAIAEFKKSHDGKRPFANWNK
jgi:hypothetical protein